MKRRPLIVFFLLFAVALGGWLFLHRLASAARPKAVAVAQAAKPDVVVPGVTVIAVSAPSSESVPQPGHPRPLLGEVMLRGYAEPAQPPENDLTLLWHLMDNSMLLLKSAANRPLSANGDWADFLRGHNAARERFLPDAHLALNTDRELVDRWGTPLFFHALGGGHYDIRSAGPDKKMWTEDDIQRNADGSFYHGAAFADNQNAPATQQPRPGVGHPLATYGVLEARSHRGP